MLLLVITTAAVLRFWQVGSWPPGLYRDEAFYGLDGLGVLAGQHALFFPANNGREPLYIYLVALSISLFSNTVLAVRLPAAVIGTLTTWITYLLGTTWFSRRVGLLAAWLWAVTLWPVHLNRIGLRLSLLPLALALAFWLGTLAYRRDRWQLWLLAGAVYGMGFYTYLAMRFTPVLLLALLAYLVWRGRRQRLWPGLLWWALGVSLALAPLSLLAWQQPELVLGRTGQVSIFNPAVNGGDAVGTLWRHTGRALGLFLWRGDDILRHNPAGRPLFDAFMALPFLAGLAWCLRQLRRPPAAAALLWTVIMLGPTILAEDPPHFLRAAGILPAVLLLPALGLAQLWQWQRLPAYVRRPLVLALVLASLGVTVRDYLAYTRQPDVAYLFETAATDMARRINQEAPGTTILIDERFWSVPTGWPSIQFLVGTSRVVTFRPETGIPGQVSLPIAIYAWPYGSLDFVPVALTPVDAGPVLITAETGSLARGDLEERAYPLYVRYTSTGMEETTTWPVLVNFDDQLQLRQASLTQPGPEQLLVTLDWSTATAVRQDVVVFVHVMGPEGLIGQDDAPLAAGHWPRTWWQPDLVVRDQHVIGLPEAYDAARHHILVGLYDATTQTRLPALSAGGATAGDTWLLQP